MPKMPTSPPETRQRPTDALERIQHLKAMVNERNKDLTAAEAEAIAEELSQAAIESLKERGEISFERDKS